MFGQKHPDLSKEGNSRLNSILKFKCLTDSVSPMEKNRLSYQHLNRFQSRSETFWIDYCFAGHVDIYSVFINICSMKLFNLEKEMSWPPQV